MSLDLSDDLPNLIALYATVQKVLNQSGTLCTPCTFIKATDSLISRYFSEATKSMNLKLYSMDPFMLWLFEVSQIKKILHKHTHYIYRIFKTIIENTPEGEDSKVIFHADRTLTTT